MISAKAVFMLTVPQAWITLGARIFSSLFTVTLVGLDGVPATPVKSLFFLFLGPYMFAHGASVIAAWCSALPLYYVIELNTRVSRYFYTFCV